MPFGSHNPALRPQRVVLQLSVRGVGEDEYALIRFEMKDVRVEQVKVKGRG